MSDDPSPSWPRRLLGFSRELGVTLIAIAILLPLVGWLRAPAMPEVAPDFTLQDLDGQEVSLEALKGQVVVLNFWATWCGPCKVEIPFFSSFADAHPDVAVLGIAVDGSVGELRSAARRLDIRYPVLPADKSTVQAQYGVSTLPTTVVVGPDGEIWSAHTGIMTTPQLWWATRRYR